MSTRTRRLSQDVRPTSPHTQTHWRHRLGLSARRQLPACVVAWSLRPHACGRLLAAPCPVCPPP